MHDAREVLQVAASWRSVDARIADLLPDRSLTVWASAEAILEQRIVTRRIDLTTRGDAAGVIGRLVTAMAAIGPVVIDDRGVGAKSECVVVHARHEPRLGSVDVRLELRHEHDDVDLRDEIELHAALVPFTPLVELAQFATGFEISHQRGGAIHASVTVELDDESRSSVHAWLAASEYQRDGDRWVRRDDRVEHVVVFERATELGVDRATTYIRPAPRAATVQQRLNASLLPPRATTAIEAR